MHLSALVGVGIGIFGVGAALRAVATGSITFVFARLLGGFGPTLEAEFDREQQPVGFWSSVAVYGLGGLAVAGACLRTLLR